jgi:xanthine dehydrogenase iron-sulfur cluster and FAD-binding subunit A
MSIRINGLERQLPSDLRVSLLDFLREHLGLHGTKKGCNQGACGARVALSLIPALVHHSKHGWRRQKWVKMSRATHFVGTADLPQ